MQSTEQSVRTGDTIVCQKCGHERRIEQNWVEATAARLKELNKWPWEPRAGYSKSLVAALPATTLQYLSCVACKSKGASRLKAVNAAVNTQQVSVEPNSDVRYAKLCSKCNGFNGLAEYCYHCGGVGYEPAQG